MITDLLEIGGCDMVKSKAVSALRNQAYILLGWTLCNDFSFLLFSLCKCANNLINYPLLLIHLS